MNTENNKLPRFFVIGDDFEDKEIKLVSICDFGVTEVVVDKKKNKDAKNNVIKKAAVPKTTSRPQNPFAKMDEIDMAKRFGRKSVTLSQSNPRFKDLQDKALKNGLIVVLAQ